MWLVGEEGASEPMKRRRTLIIVGLLFLLLLQVQASGEDQSRWNSVWPLSLISEDKTGNAAGSNISEQASSSGRSEPQYAGEKNTEERNTGEKEQVQQTQPVVPVMQAKQPVSQPQSNPAKAVAQAPAASKQPTTSTSQPSIAELYKEFGGTLFRKGPSDSKRIALTFDDGPSEVTSNQVLDVLKTYNIKATFFLVGRNVPKYPQVVQRMVYEGHVVAGHSWSHTKMDKLPPEQMQKEIASTEKAIQQITGCSIALFRPPYGSVNREGLSCLKQSGYAVINWSVDSRDWKYPDDISKVKYNTFKDVKPGAILLFHTVAGKQPSKVVSEFLPELIQTLQSQGYQFVTVDELLSVPAYK